MIYKIQKQFNNDGNKVTAPMWFSPIHTPYHWKKFFNIDLEKELDIMKREVDPKEYEQQYTCYFK